MSTVGNIEKNTQERVVKLFRKQLGHNYLGEMAEAIRSGKPYRTCVNPPPAGPRCCHAPREMNPA